MLRRNKQEAREKRQEAKLITFAVRRIKKKRIQIESAFFIYKSSKSFFLSLASFLTLFQ